MQLILKSTTISNAIIIKKLPYFTKCVTFTLSCIVFCVMKTATLNLRISPSLKEGVKKAANIEHRSIANMIEMLIRRHCDDIGINIKEKSQSNSEKPNG